MSTKQENSTFATESTNALPLVGSAFSGAVLAFLLLSFLLSLFLVLTAMPEGSSSYLFLEPRGLIVINGMVAFTSSQGVGQQFARCNWAGVAGSTVIFLLFCLMACWLDELPVLIFGLVRGRKKRREENKTGQGAKPTSNKGLIIAEKGLQTFLIVIVDFAPLYMLPALSDNEEVPGTVMVSFPFLTRA